MKRRTKANGFTLIELLLVVGIVAVILAVVVPMGIRARIDAKYGVVRQNCSELASFATQWAEQSIMAQEDDDSTATLKHYYSSLAGLQPGNSLPSGESGEAGSETGGGAAQWIATDEASNWNQNNAAKIGITGRNGDGVDAEPEAVVEQFVPPDKAIKNPFTQVNVFKRTNLPGVGGGDGEDSASPITGAIAFGGIQDGTYSYFGFCFQGTENEGDTIGDEDVFHAGMSFATAANLRNGVFMARVR